MITKHKIDDHSKHDICQCVKKNTETYGPNSHLISYIIYSFVALMNYCKKDKTNNTIQHFKHTANLAEYVLSANIHTFQLQQPKTFKPFRIPIHNSKAATEQYIKISRA